MSCFLNFDLFFFMLTAWKTLSALHTILCVVTWEKKSCSICERIQTGWFDSKLDHIFPRFTECTFPPTLGHYTLTLAITEHICTDWASFHQIPCSLRNIHEHTCLSLSLSLSYLSPLTSPITFLTMKKNRKFVGNQARLECPLIHKSILTPKHIENEQKLTTITSYMYLEWTWNVRLFP